MLAVAVGVTAISARARGFGPGGPGGPRASFSDLDANGDGVLTVAELEAFGKARFDATDADGDGFVTIEEMHAHMMQQMQEKKTERGAKILEHKDTDGDGKLSFEEMRPSDKRQDKMFGKLDADGNGEISQEEFAQAQMKMRDHRKDRRAKKILE